MATHTTTVYRVTTSTTGIQVPAPVDVDYQAVADTILALIEAKLLLPTWEGPVVTYQDSSTVPAVTAPTVPATDDGTELVTIRHVVVDHAAVTYNAPANTADADAATLQAFQGGYGFATTGAERLVWTNDSDTYGIVLITVPG
jgi:hypothetical protein